MTWPDSEPRCRWGRCWRMARSELRMPACPCGSSTARSRNRGSAVSAGYDAARPAARAGCRTGRGVQRAPRSRHSLRRDQDTRPWLHAHPHVRTPTMVRQEFSGLLLTHHTAPSIHHEAAPAANEDSERLPFTHAVPTIRRRGQVKPQGVKRRVRKYSVRHRGPLFPTGPSRAIA